MSEDLIPVRRTLVSVFDKTGVDELARGLAALGVTLVSTGSTAAVLRGGGVKVTDVSAVTDFPELLDGRVKTLHPAIHAGILADRSKPEHAAALAEHGIEPIDLVVGNLYPFRQTVAAGGTEAEVIEMIDIGGPTMIRAAAKNAASVAVVVSPEDYPALLAEVRERGGTTAATRQRLAARAFAHTAAYDTDVAAWFVRAQPFPEQLGLTFQRTEELRYGENPHQAAAFYGEAGPRWGLGSARQLGGKALSYNNLLDADAAWLMASDFDQACVVIVKHMNPAGVAVAETLQAAYPAALAGDPVSAFGGIVAVNRPLDAGTATAMAEVFTEVVIAPSFTSEALELLRGKRNLRLLEITEPVPPAQPRVLRSVSGGLLVQDADTAAEIESEWTVPTRVAPDQQTLAELRFAWRVAKHTKSNAIVLTRDRAAVGVGAGQMSRVDSVRIAVQKSEGRCNGAVLASDAYFPFRDGPAAALSAGVVAMISPGGSVRDAEVVAACDDGGVPMVFTGRRHFRH